MHGEKVSGACRANDVPCAAFPIQQQLFQLLRFVCRPCRCDAKDQMIHLFAMPQAWDPYSPADELARGLQREAAQEAAAARGEL